MRRSLAVVALLWLAVTAAFAQQIAVRAVGPIGMTVGDMDRAITFYNQVLRFQKVSDDEFAGEEFEYAKGVFGARARVVRMRLGTEEIELTQYFAPEGSPFPIGTHGNDRWFQHVAIIVRDMDEAYALLRSSHVRYASSGPQTLPGWNKNAGGIKAFYFRDPDGHFLELLEFPADKGAAKWHRKGSELFLGIDHTAITVADTEAALRFYRDTLGMTVAGASENYGPEQEHLNNVFGARLRITALRAPDGPGIELLEYLAPHDGRPYPPDARANDVLHWETHLELANAAEPFVNAKRLRLPLLSPRPASYDQRRTEFHIQDPDGHVIALIAPKEN